MSLARLMLRLATVRALRGRTFAGDIVRDSEIGPIDETAERLRLPFVVVYTDDATSVGDGTDLMTHSGATALVLEIGVTTRATPTDEWELPTTDAGIELTIDAIERQARVALANPENSWGELWRDLVMRIGEGKSQRGAAAKEGVRFGGRQVLITVDLPRDPHPGKTPGGIWARFLALVAADPDPNFAALAPTLTTLITGGAVNWADWQVVRAAYGLSQARADAMLLTPPGPPAAAPDSP